jgi:hypothetical protein
MKIFFLIFMYISLSFAEYTNVMLLDDKTTLEQDLSLPEMKEEDINNVVKSEAQNQLKIAVIINKQKFFRYIPSLMNSIGAYLLNKDIDFKVRVFDMNISLDEITQNYNNIFIYSTNQNIIQKLNLYPNNNFFLPIINKNQLDYNTTAGKNIYFGGLDFKKQVLILDSFVFNQVYLIKNNKDISNLITKIEMKNIEFKNVYNYPLNYEEVKKDFNNSIIFVNTGAVDTAQILSNFTFYDIKPQLVLSTQINYNPLIFSITSEEDTEKLIIASSLFNPNLKLLDINLNLGSNLDFNWLNYTTSVLLNKVYIDDYMNENKYFLNDFNLYIFDNQVIYKVKLFKIFKHGFVEIK